MYIDIVHNFMVLNEIPQGLKQSSGFGGPRVQQGIPWGFPVFACLLTHSMAILLAILKALLSLTPQFW